MDGKDGVGEGIINMEAAIATTTKTTTTKMASKMAATHQRWRRRRL
jgi:hypothetical protein